MSVSAEMPKYKCHKEVWALKVSAIHPQFKKADDDVGVIPDGVVVVPAEEGYAPFFVEQAWFDRHKPQVGGYIVHYQGGYVSYSPEYDFESGYTRIK